MKKLIIAGAAIASMMAFSATASAESLGEQGQIAILSDLQVGFQYESPDKGDSTTTFLLRPALDYFVIDGLSIGGMLGFGYGSQGDTSTTLFGIGPRVGYAIGITDAIAFWPKLGFIFEYTSSKAEDQGISETVKNTIFSLDIYAPFTFSPADNFFLGIGPNFNIDLVNKAKVEGPVLSGEVDNKVLSFGAISTIGGYF